MKIMNSFRSFLLEDNFEIHIYKNKINILNYTSIGHFDSNKIIVYSDSGYITIKGENLVVTKLMKDEVLITGTVAGIELR